MTERPVEWIPLKRHLPTPLYIQIRDQVVAQIEGGELQPGDRLPSEPDLTRVFRVGRPTVRQAIDLLRREGFVTIRRGAGTFVARQPQQISLLSFDGLTHSLRVRGIELVDEIVDRAVRDHPPLEVLKLAESSSWWTVTRRRWIDRDDVEREHKDQPFCLETDSFPLDLCPDASSLFERTGSAAAVLEEGYGLKIASYEVATRAVSASGAIRKHLGVRAGAPLLAMERINRSSTSDVVHVATFVLRTDEVQIIEHIVNPT